MSLCFWRTRALGALGPLLVMLVIGTGACGGGRPAGTPDGGDGGGTDVGADTPSPVDRATPDVDRLDGPPADEAADLATDGPVDGTPPDLSGDGGTCRPGEPNAQLIDRTLTGIVLGDFSPAHTARSFRVRARYNLGCGQERALTRTTVDSAARTVSIRVRAWDLGLDCAAADQADERWITVAFPEEGTWTFRDEVAGGTATLTVQVGAPLPAGDCTPSPNFGDCDRDCQCPTGLCLGYESLVGAATGCFQPCEINLDCDGGRCTDTGDGPLRACETSLPQCDEQSPCPEGMACEKGSCQASFRLGQATRKPCTCDADCDAGLDCVASPLADGTSRCERRCQSSGAWCGQGLHVCGEAQQDVAGLAEAGAVCIFVGE